LFWRALKKDVGCKRILAFIIASNVVSLPIGYLLLLTIQAFFQLFFSSATILFLGYPWPHLVFSWLAMGLGLAAAFGASVFIEAFIIRLFLKEPSLARQTRDLTISANIWSYSFLMALGIILVLKEF
jgi:hypothetical protein